MWSNAVCLIFSCYKTLHWHINGYDFTFLEAVTFAKNGTLSSLHCADHCLVVGNNYAIICQLGRPTNCQYQWHIYTIHVPAIPLSAYPTGLLISWMRMQRRQQLRKRYIFIILLSEHYSDTTWKSKFMVLYLNINKTLVSYPFYSVCWWPRHICWYFHRMYQ